MRKRHPDETDDLESLNGGQRGKAVLGGVKGGNVCCP